MTPNDHFNKVIDHQQKQQTYTLQYERLKNAIQGEFYFEAIFILYSLLEDRFNALYYYAGLVDRDEAGDIVNLRYPKEFGFKKQPKLGITNKNTMLVDLSNMLVHSVKLDQPSYSADFLSILDILVQKLDPVELQNFSNELTTWIEKRNQLIHRLIQTKISDQNSELSKLALDGKTLLLKLDSWVKRLKRLKQRKQGNDLSDTES